MFFNDLLAMNENKIPEIFDVYSQTIKGRLIDEGIQARNLIKYNVPLFSRKKTLPSNDTKQVCSGTKSDCDSGHVNRENETSFQLKGCGDVSSVNRVPLAIYTDPLHVSKVSTKGSDYRARYWGQMMDTLKRTIDEIYSACETDESEVECKEVIMILEHTKKDFYSLIEKMNLFKEIENSTIENRSTNYANKPVFIAWDERKISPGKPIMKQVLEKTKRAHSHSGQSSSTISQTDLQTSTKETRLPIDSELAKDISNNNSSAKLTSPSQTICETNICTWADKVKSRITNQKGDIKDSPVIRIPENGVVSSNKARKQQIKTCKKGSQLKPKSIQNSQSIMSRIKSTDSKKSSVDIDNESDGEWETVCRTKFSQRVKLIKQLHRANRNQTFSDGLKRHNLMTKDNDKSIQSLKRNKSKSETNLQLSNVNNTHFSGVGNGAGKAPNVVKYYSSIVMSNDLESIDVEDFGNRWSNPPVAGRQTFGGTSNKNENDNSSHCQKSFSAPQKRNQKTVQKSFIELNKNLFGKCHENKSCSSKPLDPNSEFSDRVDGNNKVSVVKNDVKESSSTSVENSTDEFGDDDETTQKIRKLNQKLIDVENAETELQNELGRAQEEEKAYREQIEQEAALESESKNEFSQQVTTPEYSENVIIDDNDDGYDFVLNLDLDKCDSPSVNNSNENQPVKSLLPFDEIKNKIDIFPLEWSQVNDDGDEDSFQDNVTKLRTPGRCVEMHQKLSAPSRKRSINSIQQLEKKQAKAKELRERLLLDRTEKVRELTKKVEEVRLHKSGLLDEKKLWMEQKLNKAETKRQQQLDERVKKAHDEDMKGKEIAFIQSLEAAQKQHTILTKHQESEARLLERQEERKKRMEEKAEREVAAEIRRKTLESNRQAWINDLQLRWKTREEDLAFKAENRERQRLLAVRAKEAEREQKKMELERQQKSQIEQLKEKISKKHEDSERRHQEQLAEISRKAFEMSIAKYSLEENSDAPPIEPYVNKKWCNVCNIMIDSDVLLQSHLNGKKHKNTVIEQLSGQNIEKDQFRIFNLEHIVDAPVDKTDPKIQAKKDRRKAVKKRTKKLKQRIISNTTEFEKFCEQLHNDGVFQQSANKQKIFKFIKDIKRYIAIQDTGPWVTVRVSSLEKSLGDLLRCMNIKKPENVSLNQNQKAVISNQIMLEQNTFLSLGGISVLGTLVHLIQAQKSENSPVLPEKTFKLIFKCVRKTCHANNNVCHYILFSTFITSLLEGLQAKLSFLIPDNFIHYIQSLYENQSGFLPENRELPTNTVVEQILLTLTVVFDNFVSNFNSESAYHKLSGENSGRSSSLSTTSNKFDLRNESQKVQDIVSYVVSTGIVDILSDYLCQVRGPLKGNSPTANFVLIILSFLSTLLKMLALNSGKVNTFLLKSPNCLQKPNHVDSSCLGNGDRESVKSLVDHTQLLQSIEGTEMCGLICLLYGILLYQGNVVSRSDPLSQLTGRVTISGLKLINNLAVVNLSIVQSVLSQEGISLQLRHILSFLTSYCNEQMIKSVSKGSSISNCYNHDYSKASTVSTDSETFSVQELLHEVILCIGYFCVNNTDNQNFVQSGQRPTILQQLCQLPFGYFSQKNLIQCLYPTLISCCYKNLENTAILESEMTSGLMAAFIQEKITEESEGVAKAVSSNYDSRFDLQYRFPFSHWKNAKTYFDR